MGVITIASGPATAQVAEPKKIAVRDLKRPSPSGAESAMAEPSCCCAGTCCCCNIFTRPGPLC
jgi:hypothetical protein